MKNSEGKMKKVFTGLILLTILFLSAGCDNDTLNLPQMTEPASDMGRLTVELDGTDGRTLLPETPVFSRYALTFRYMDGGISEINRTADSLPFSIELLPGNWRVSVTGYVYIEDVEGILDGDYPVASGEETVTIEAGVNTPVSVDLYRENTGVQGIFQYDIGLPDSVSGGATLKILQTDKTVITTKDLLEAASGSIALDEGYYLVQVRVVTGRVRSKTELIHIYSGHTTVAEGAAWDFDTEEGVYLSLAELSTFLSATPVNTADNPYPVKLITDWAALSTPNEFLGQMYSVLNGRYISVDLSETANVDGIVATTAYSANRNRLVSAVLPEGLTEIDGGAFQNCTGLTSITIPDSVINIGESAFSGCTGLTGVTIPDSVTSIGGSAFSGCTGLTSVTIPDSVTSIGGSAFSGCTGLTGVTIGNGVTGIGSSAFSGCTGLTGVNIPDSVISIGSSAFSGCTGLTGVIIPDSVISIGESAFSGCTGLTGVTIGSNVASIGSSAFGNCANLTVTIQTNKIQTTSSNNWNTIFSNNTALSVIFGYGVTGIGSNAFNGCTWLIGVTIPDSVTSIGNNAFYGCTGLENVIIGNGVTSLNGFNFSGNTNLTSVIIGNKVTGIGSDAFRGCTRLTSVIIGNKITSIGNDAFRGCTRLTSIVIPESVTTVGSYAFYGWTSSQTINIKCHYSQTVADAAWGSSWRSSCNAAINYYFGIDIITAPIWREGDAVSLAAPPVTLPDGQTVTAQGWQISDTASGNGNWANFTPPATAGISYNGKYVRYYAESSGGQTYYSNAVNIIVIYLGDMVVTNTAEWNAARSFISDGGNDRAYTVCIDGDIGITGGSFGTATGITVTLTGSGKLYLTSRVSIITLAADQTLIIDSAGLTLQGLTSGQNGATQDNNRAVVYVNGSNAQLELRNGTISGNTTPPSGTFGYGGGGVYVSGGTFTMNGGEISGNNTTTIPGVSHPYDKAYGGGVYMNGGTFTMNGGAISGNTTNSTSSSTYGGGVYVSGGTFTMNGGTISGNTASGYNYGGGVYIDSSSSSFTMNGGTISGNTAYAGGGVSFYGSSSSFTMNGGTISGNTSSNYGGGVFVSGGTFTMSGGTISGNTTNGGRGGGVFMSSYGTFRIVTGTVYGSDAGALSNTAAGTGGAALYAENGTAQRGTFSGETWNNLGSIELIRRNNNYNDSYTNDTINVINGNLVGVSNINAPAWHEGSAVSLAAPTVTLPAGQTITAQGWQISDTGSGGWANVTAPASADMSLNGKYLRYYAALSGGQTYYSNAVRIAVYASDFYPNQVTIAMYASGNNGWDGTGALRIVKNGTQLAAGVKATGSSSTYTFYVASGDVIQFYWVAGTYQNLNSFIAYFTIAPPSPEFTSSNNNSWNGTNALVYGLRGTMDIDGTLLGSFTVP